MNFDVLVVGSGLAGLTAACRARELGARVLVAEKTPDPPGWNNSRISSGAFHITLANLETPADELVQRILDVTTGTARIELARTLVQEAQRTIRWLKEHGLHFVPWGPDHIWTADPPGMERRGFVWKDFGTDRNLDSLYNTYITLGGAYWNDTQVVELLHTEGRVTGARLVRADNEALQVTAAAVVLADGGFQANHEMVKRYISPAPDRMKLRATNSGMGDGIRMALGLGAKCVNMQYFYGHCLHQESLQNDDLWPYPVLDSLITAGIIVDPGGQRIVNEGGGDIFVANTLARRQNPQDTWVIFDQAIWNGPGASIDIGMPPNPVLQEVGASVCQAKTLTDLGTMISVDPIRLETTVAEYNTAVMAENTQLLPVPRTAAPHHPYPLSQSPYYAVPIVPAMTHTLGGLLISSQTEVLDNEDHPIPGLYAAGATAGGLDGGPRVGYVGGLIQASVFGLLAGETVARKVSSP